LTLGTREDIVVDFYPESGNYIDDVLNTIYFEAFTNQNRSDSVDFDDASLISEDSDGNNDTVIDASIKTTHRGKGVFNFTIDQDKKYYLVIPDVGGKDLRKLIDIEAAREKDDSNNAINFALEKKVIDNDEDLKINFYANENLDTDDTYVVKV